jgi:hypothetical protein
MPGRKHNVKPIRKMDKFWLVKFQAKKKTDKSDPDKIPVPHNGNNYEFKRNIVVPIHEGHKCNLDNAAFTVYEEPEEDVEMNFTLTVAGTEKRFPYEIIGKINGVAYEAARVLMISRKTELEQWEIDQFLNMDFTELIDPKAKKVATG